MSREYEQIAKRAVELYFLENVPAKEAVKRAEQEYRREHESVSGSDGRQSNRTGDAGSVQEMRTNPVDQ